MSDVSALRSSASRVAASMTTGKLRPAAAHASMGPAAAAGGGGGSGAATSDA